MPINFGIDIPTCPIATGTAAIFNWMARLVGSRHRLQAFQENPEMNLVDAAIARPISADLVEKRILEIGEPQGVGEGTLGLKIRKSGRTTGLTSEPLPAQPPPGIPSALAPAGHGTPGWFSSLPPCHGAIDIIPIICYNNGQILAVKHDAWVFHQI